jgi:hypothetical protein
MAQAVPDHCNAYTAGLDRSNAYTPDLDRSNAYTADLDRSNAYSADLDRYNANSAGLAASSTAPALFILTVRVFTNMLKMRESLEKGILQHTQIENC